MIRRHAPLAIRLAPALAALLARVLPRAAVVLELGSGTGEHAVHLARALPWLTWQPSDPDPGARASIAAWRAEAALPNLLPPLDLDLLAPAWRLRCADALLVVNVLHAAPPAAADALLGGAGEVLPPGGALVVVGPSRAPDGEALSRVAAGAARHDLAVEEHARLGEGCDAIVVRARSR